MFIASLVAAIFMHLKWEANWKYVLTVPASIMSVFLMLMLIPDIGLRTRWYAEERWLYAPLPVKSTMGMKWPTMKKKNPREMRETSSRKSPRARSIDGFP